jgi:thioredoxin reductase
MNDVIIIGGSFAGLAAALQLGRARRKVTVLDTGLRAIPRSGWSMPGPTASPAPSTISPS